MRSIIFDAPRKIRVGDWETPKPGPGEVLINTRATGVCAGDLYIYQGKNPYAVYPQVAGHEVAGEIVEIGAGVEDFKVGEAVVVEPFIGCGTCYPCRVGKSNCCANLRIVGVHFPGGFGEMFVAPAKNVYRIPAGMSFADASFAEPVAIGVQATRRGAVSKGELVVVIGCGPIGLAIIEVARAKGARVVATDLQEGRRRTAESFGAEVAPPGDALLPHIMELTSGEGAAVVVEATGSEKAMEQTVDLVAAGGRIVIVGLVKEGARVSFPGLDFTRKEMTVVGSRASTRCFPESLELLASGAIRYPEIATRLQFWDGPRAIVEMDEHPGKYHKVILER